MCSAAAPLVTSCVWRMTYCCPTRTEYAWCCVFGAVSSLVLCRLPDGSVPDGCNPVPAPHQRRSHSLRSNGPPYASSGPLYVVAGFTYCFYVVVHLPEGVFGCATTRRPVFAYPSRAHAAFAVLVLCIKTSADCCRVVPVATDQAQRTFTTSS